SSQVGSAHLPSRQTKLSQSRLKRQLLPGLHAWQGPPQSLSPSPGLRIPSLHVAATHSSLRQERLSQSSPAEQAFPTAQGAQGPPQSSSLSPWLRSPSPQ